MFQPLPRDLSPPTQVPAGDVVVNDREGGGGLYVVEGSVYRDLLRMARGYLEVTRKGGETVFDKCQGLSAEEVQGVSSFSWDDGLTIWEGGNMLTPEPVSVTVMYGRLSVHTSQPRVQVIPPIDIECVSDVTHNTRARRLALTFTPPASPTRCVSLECYDQSSLRSLYYVILTRHSSHPAPDPRTLTTASNLPKTSFSRFSPSRSPHAAPLLPPPLSLPAGNQSETHSAGHPAMQSVGQRTSLVSSISSLHQIPQAMTRATSSVHSTPQVVPVVPLSQVDASVDDALAHSRRSDHSHSHHSSVAPSAASAQVVARTSTTAPQVSTLKVPNVERQRAVVIQPPSVSQVDIADRRSSVSSKTSDILLEKIKHLESQVEELKERRSNVPSRSSSTLLASEEGFATHLRLSSFTSNVSCISANPRPTMPQGQLEEQVRHVIVPDTPTSSASESPSGSGSASASPSEMGGSMSMSTRPQTATKCLIISISYSRTPLEIPTAPLAHTLSRFLIDIGFLAEQCLLADTIDESQPTKKNIMTAAKWLLRGAEAGAALFFSVAGRGKGKELYPLDFADGGLATEELSHLLASSLPKGCKLTVLCDLDTGPLMHLPYKVSYGPSGVQESRPGLLQAPHNEGVIIQLTAEPSTSALKRSRTPLIGKFSEAAISVLRENPQISIGSLLPALYEKLDSELLPCVSSNHSFSSISEFTLENDVV